MSEGKEGEPKRCLKEGCGVLPHLILDSGWCFSHDPSLAKERFERARKGGEMSARGRRPGLSERELPPLRGPKTAAKWAEEIGRAVASNRITAAAGSATLKAVKLHLQAREATEVETRLRKLSKKLDELKNGQ